MSSILLGESSRVVLQCRFVEMNEEEPEDERSKLGFMDGLINRNSVEIFH